MPSRLTTPARPPPGNSNVIGRSRIGFVPRLLASVGLQTIAEGLEDQNTMEGLRHFDFDFDCDQVQGYFFSRPLPADALSEWFCRNSAAAHVAASMS